MPYTTIYCERCGHIGFSLLDNIDEETCFTCNTKGTTKPVPNEYLDKIGDFADDLKDKFIEEVVKKSPNFSQEAFERLPEIQAQRKRQDEMLKLSSQKQSGKVICPYCQSTSVSRIGLLNRIVSVELWGLASSKIGKQWRCNDCGSEF